jgi:N-acetylglucosamine kinase-like BadF-type ATPase
MKHFVAIDGGNSKTDLVVGASDGSVLAFVRGAGSSPDRLGVDGSISVVNGLMVTALNTAGVTPDLVMAYLAGIDLPIEVDTYRKAVDDAGWAPTHIVDNDLFALLRAGTGDPNAIAVICGAGINCVGRRNDGTTARFPALGDISGDWGGGHHLAMLALWHAARGEDTRGPVTALTDAVRRHFGSPSVEEVGNAVHLGQIDRLRIDELCPVLFAVAETGDPLAVEVVATQAREIVGMARVAAQRLDLTDKPHTIVLGGGVLTARHALLNDAVAAGLAKVAPHGAIEIVADRPVTGAALLALDTWGPVPPALEARIRSEVAAAAPASASLPPQSTVRSVHSSG